MTPAHQPHTSGALAQPTTPAKAGALAPDEQAQLQILRAHRRSHRLRRPPVALGGPAAAALRATTAAATAATAASTEHLGLAPPSRGQRLADGVAATIGSWRFIIFQSTAIVLWISGNVLVGQGAWDPYPFILLNLLLSFQAAYTAPAIMMSQNRQSEQDRRHAENDYEVNVKAELEIELLHEKVDLLKERELLALTEAVRLLAQRIEGLQAQLAQPRA